LIDATPTRQTATLAVNAHAKREQRRIRAATYADQQAQWRAEADAIARHRTRSATHTEEIRKAQVGFRAAVQERNQDGIQAWLRLLSQLQSHQPG
jgi:hypothetical protein